MAKTKRPVRQKEVKVEKVQRKKEEVFATAISFLFMGAYVLITGNIPNTIIGWAKFIGLFVLILVVVYLIAVTVVKIKKGTKK